MTGEEEKVAEGIQRNITTKSTAKDNEKSDPKQLLWIKFSEQAWKFVEDTHMNEDEKLSQKIIVTLETITKILFGLDSEDKSWNVLYGKGTLELIVALYNKSKSHDKKVHLCTLKALKTCVIRNPHGRSRCRSAGVFNTMRTILDLYIKSKDSEIAEEGLTTLAAICMGDDLNSLQGSTDFDLLVKEASLNFPVAESQGIHQKIMYLNALFDALRKEQSQLLSIIKEKQELFFSHVTSVELQIRDGRKSIESESFAEAEINFDKGMNMLVESDYMSHTKLLDEYKLEIHETRAKLRLTGKNPSGCIEDLDQLLEHKISVQRRCNALKLKAAAYTMLDKTGDAREALGKALVLNPSDNDLKAQMESLNIK